MLSYQRLVLSSCRSSKLSPTTSKNWTTRCVSSSGNSEGVKEEEKKFDIASGNIQERSKLVTPKVTTKPLNFEEARDLAQLALGQQKKLLEQKLESLKMIFGGQSDIQRTVNQEWYYKKVSFWMKRYENFVGLTEVKAAQARVVEFERKFIDTQDLRREVQLKLADVQKRVKDIHVELEKTHRGEDRYLVLVTQEHQVLKEEGNLLDEFKFHEKSERENFSLLSNSVRDSHEKERAQAEKTKYWSVIGSVIGTCIGIFGTTINNRMRMNELRRLVSQNSSVEEIRGIGDKLTVDFSGHQTALSNLVTDVTNVVTKAEDSLNHLDRMEGLLDSLQESSDKINTRLLDQTLTDLQDQQQQLVNNLKEQQQQLDSTMNQIQKDLLLQSKSVSQLSHITLKDREKDHLSVERRDRETKKQMELLAKESESLESVMVSSSREIKDMMKDVRSLLIMESQLPKVDMSRWTECLSQTEQKLSDILRTGFEGLNSRLVQASKVRQETLAAINSKFTSSSDSNSSEETPEQLHLVEIDSVVELVEGQYKRTQQTLILSVAVVSILTPIAVLTINYLL